MTPLSKSLRTVWICSGGKPQSMTTGRFISSRASMKGGRRSSRVEHMVVPCGRQSVSVEHPRFFDIEVQESLLLFEPPAEG